MRVRHTSSAAWCGLGFALALMLACSSRDCPDIACASGIVVTVSSNTWPDGAYVVAAQGEGVDLACSFGVGSAAGAPSCTPGMLWIELPPTAGVARFRVDGAPPSVVLRVERNGAILAMKSAPPKYDDVTPYPKDCGPTCLEAKVDVALQ